MLIAFYCLLIFYLWDFKLYFTPDNAYLTWFTSIIFRYLVFVLGVVIVEKIIKGGNHA